MVPRVMSLVSTLKRAILSTDDEMVPAAAPATTDPVLAILGRQSASGLWEEHGRDPVEVTVAALLALLRLGLTTSHAVYGAQVKKAVDALLVQVAAAPTSPDRGRELAYAVAWLVASGRRTRQSIESTARAASDLSALATMLGDERAVRAHVDRLAAR